MNNSPILGKASSEFKGIKCSPYEITTNSYTIAIDKNIQNMNISGYLTTSNTLIHSRNILSKITLIGTLNLQYLAGYRHLFSTFTSNKYSMNLTF